MVIFTFFTCNFDFRVILSKKNCVVISDEKKIGAGGRKFKNIFFWDCPTIGAGNPTTYNAFWCGLISFFCKCFVFFNIFLDSYIESIHCGRYAFAIDKHALTDFG